MSKNLAVMVKDHLIILVMPGLKQSKYIIMATIFC